VGGFNDPVLTQLVDIAQRQNNTLELVRFDVHFAPLTGAVCQMMERMEKLFGCQARLGSVLASKLRSYCLPANLLAK
jgi:hypothetical protein